MTAAVVALLSEPWDEPWRAPQHLLTRIARTLPVVAVEPALPCASGVVERRQKDGVTLLRPLRPSHDGALDERMMTMVQEAAGPDVLVWSFVPDGTAVADALDARHFVRAAELPHGVDVHAFASTSTFEPHPLVRDLHAPLLTFAGTIDARVDPVLVGALAEMGANVVLAGPADADAARGLPRSPNVHCTGRLDRREIPALVHASDAAIVPFAHLDGQPPTQALEAFAAGVPVLIFAPSEAPWSRFASYVDDVRTVERVVAEVSDDAARRDEARAYAVQYDWDDAAERVRRELFSYSAPEPG